jgi:hypothetical protein
VHKKWKICSCLSKPWNASLDRCPQKYLDRRLTCWSVPLQHGASFFRPDHKLQGAVHTVQCIWPFVLCTGFPPAILRNYAHFIHHVHILWPAKWPPGCCTYSTLNFLCLLYTAGPNFRGGKRKDTDMGAAYCFWLYNWLFSFEKQKDWNIEVLYLLFLSLHRKE